MTKEEKKALYKCNVGDFLRKFKDKKYAVKDGPNAQFGDALTYLAKYNMKGSTKECDFFDLVYAVKKSLINQAVDKNKKLPYQQMINDYGDNLDAVQTFINNPIEFLHDSFKAYADNDEEDIEIDPDKKEFNSRLKENVEDLSKTLQTQAKRYKEYEAKAKAKELEYSILSKLPGDAKNLDDVFEKNKGGFLERTFNTTSQDYKNFTTAFREYRNPDNVHFADDRHVEIEAIKYLQHVIPAYRDDSELPTKAQLEALTGTKKGRADFCVSVIEAIRERREKEDALEGVMENIENDAGIEESVIEDEQSLFQEQIQKDLKDSVEVDQQNEINDNEINVEKEVEEPNIK